VTQLLKQAYRLAGSPAPRIRRLPEKRNERQGFFSESEIRNVIKNLPAALQDFTLFGCLTGMRKGEIASLAWEDVDGDCIRLRAENAKNYAIVAENDLRTALRRTQEFLKTAQENVVAMPRKGPTATMAGTVRSSQHRQARK